MNINWFELGNWVAQALISFLFGALGAFVAFRYSISLENYKERKESKKRIREELIGGPLPPANIERAVEIARGGRKYHPSRMYMDEDETELGRTESDDVENIELSGILWAKSSTKSGRIIKLADGLVISRSSIDVLLDDDKVSDPHARFHENFYTFVVEDLDSSWGTFVNGIKIDTPTSLKENDEITIGSMLYVLKILSPSKHKNGLKICKFHGPYYDDSDKCPYCEADRKGKHIEDL